MDDHLQHHKWQSCCQLIRINNPIGFFLLLWPTLWSLWIAGMSTPPLKTIVVFVLGVFLMRSAGCVINDYADRKIDGHIKRTRYRPLPSGTIKEKEAKILFFTLVGIAFLLVLTLNKVTIWLSTIALVLACLYPFMKRYIYLPQLVLGLAFSSSILMAFTDISASLDAKCWLLFFSNVTWTVAYDTQYAMIDRDDDLLIGIKSAAIFFGRFDSLIIGLLQLTMLVCLVILGWKANLSKIYYMSIISSAAFFLWQQKLISRRKKSSYVQAFLNNNLVGMLIFIGIVFSL